MAKTDVIEWSKAHFRNRLDPELVSEVETWDDYHQDFFWAYVYKRFQQILDAQMLEEILHGDRSVHPIGIANAEPSATPFRDAERSIGPGAWFTTGCESIIGHR